MAARIKEQELSPQTPQRERQWNGQFAVPGPKTPGAPRIKKHRSRAVIVQEVRKMVFGDVEEMQLEEGEINEGKLLPATMSQDEQRKKSRAADEQQEQIQDNYVQDLEAKGRRVAPEPDVLELADWMDAAINAWEAEYDSDRGF